MSNLRPNFIAHNVEELTPSAVKGLRIEAVAFDVDGTLSDYHADRVEASVVKMLRDLGDNGLKTVIISNAYGHRVDQLNDIYGDLITGDVITPESLVALEGEDSRQYRKPSPDMIIHAGIRLGVEASKTLMVGDQIFKDVVSANRAGAQSVLVPRRGKGDFWGVRFQRPVEAGVRLGMGITLRSPSTTGGNDD